MGTKEAIDPVRYISNHSSGKMGMALAHSCIQAGAETTLIIGSISVEVEKRAEIIYITSANEMFDEVMKKIKTSRFIYKLCSSCRFQTNKYKS